MLLTDSVDFFDIREDCYFSLKSQWMNSQLDLFSYTLKCCKFVNTRYNWKIFTEKLRLTIDTFHSSFFIGTLKTAEVHTRITWVIKHSKPNSVMPFSSCNLPIPQIFQLRHLEEEKKGSYFVLKCLSFYKGMTLMRCSLTLLAPEHKTTFAIDTCSK